MYRHLSPLRRCPGFMSRPVEVQTLLKVEVSSFLSHCVRRHPIPKTFSWEGLWKSPTCSNLEYLIDIRGWNLRSSCCEG
ncbi:hypothetical protein ILYODFUR_003535 [Ilyodon furcidens]|uniref:Uncharacterized protein n=1 Tax=Ilyodon furcidens TaxID=33524 RepID=A0ABV0T6K9_9TELE